MKTGMVVNEGTALKPKFKTLVVGLVLSLLVSLCFAGVVKADETSDLEELVLNAPNNSAAPFSTKLTISGSIRARAEYNGNYDYYDAQDSAGTPAAPARPDAFADSMDFWLLRTRVAFAFAATDGVDVYVQLQDARQFGAEVATASNAVTVNGSANVDLHQAYFVLSDLGGYWPEITIGRQELSYGNERLVGAFGWSNTGRSFDGIKLVWTSELWTIDMFFTNVGDSAVTLADDDTLFNGAYGSYDFIKADDKSLTGQLYFLQLKSGSGAWTGEPDTGGPAAGRTGDLDLWTIGTNWDGTYHRFDYGFELAMQTGDWAHDDVSSLAFHINAGYTFDFEWQPRLGLEYNSAEGDSDQTDNDHETFTNLFPTNHGKYGYMDQISWQNMTNFRISLSMNPYKKWTVDLDYHIFNLEEEADAYYTVGGAARAGTGGIAAMGRGQAGNLTLRDDDIGTEFDLTVKNVLNSHVNYQFGYSIFTTGDFLDDSSALNANTGLPDGSDNADWAHFQINVKF